MTPSISILKSLVCLVLMLTSVKAQKRSVDLDTPELGGSVYYLIAASSQYKGLTVHRPNSYPKHFYLTGFNEAEDFLNWSVTSSKAEKFQVYGLIDGSSDEELLIQVLDSAGQELSRKEYAKSESGWVKDVMGEIEVPAGKSSIRLTRLNDGDKCNIKSLELIKTKELETYNQRVQSLRADTSWFTNAPYGLMFQYGAWGYPKEGERKTLNEHADSFDVEKLVELVKSTGAKHVIWSISWYEYAITAPIKSVDEIVGNSSLTSNRDLLEEILTALNNEGIKVLFYYHRGNFGSKIWSSAWWDEQNYPHSFRLYGTGDRSLFFENWVKVIT